MDGKITLIALVCLTILAWMGVRYILENWNGWRWRFSQAWTRFTMRANDADKGARGMLRYLGARALEPIIFTGLFVLSMSVWVLTMLAIGFGPILTALSIAFPGAAVAYHLARIGTRLCRRYCERSK